MKLNAHDRKKMSRSEFAGPGKSYPIEDRAHAANAKARATQAVKAGRMSKAEAARIKTRADQVLEGKRRR